MSGEGLVGGAKQSDVEESGEEPPRACVFCKREPHFRLFQQ